MPPPGFKFCYPIRVRYHELDPQAVVFHARYLEYADVAITEYWRGLGLPVLPGPGDPEFQLVRVEVDYEAPLRLDDDIVAAVRATEIGRSSMKTLVEIHGARGGSRKASINEVHVNVDLASGKPAPIPTGTVEQFETFEMRALTSSGNRPT